MPSKPKTWQEKFQSDRKPEVKLLSFDFAGLKRGTTMLVSSPAEIDKFIRKIPTGKSVSIEELRAALAKKHKADSACPASTPIFLRVVSEAAFEAVKAGKSFDEITPFWRVVHPESKLAQKLECGADLIRSLRANEGIID
ncbi:MAG: MGMT family protein [Anaerolineae bacterium]|nr:MGMT family protein [Anaerolineae bacterium]